MVHTMVRSVFTMLRTVLMTLAAALASNLRLHTAKKGQHRWFGKASNSGLWMLHTVT